MAITLTAALATMEAKRYHWSIGKRELPIQNCTYNETPFKEQEENRNFSQINKN